MVRLAKQGIVPLSNREVISITNFHSFVWLPIELVFYRSLRVFFIFVSIEFKCLLTFLV